MLQELMPNECFRATNLFLDLDYSLSIRALIEGNSPGRIFVDEPLAPKTAFALTVEGYFLAGDYENSKTNQELRHFLKEKIFTGKVYVNSDTYMSLGIYPSAWEDRLPELIPSHEVEKFGCYHYLCDQVTLDWRGIVRDGYELFHVNRSFFNNPDITFPEDVRSWSDIEGQWGSLDNFFEKGVSYCVVHEGEVVSWCVPDCVAEDQIEVGIITHPAHRRRGLASVAVAVTVEHCLNHGFSKVGWHCVSDNVGSWKTAERVGFERSREYDAYYYIYDEVDHLAELGWHYFKRGEYKKTVMYYDRVFGSRDENPDYYYHLAAAAWAALGDSDKALRYLHAAVDHGWRRPENTKDVEEFEILHGTSGWDAVLERMK
ncbi:MAG: GNAT family N-acetyltransferase [Anaerolineales bacterium]|nr:GNAT family N-acetyltransferase [Anaerolineales bacterium]